MWLTGKLVWLMGTRSNPRTNLSRKEYLLMKVLFFLENSSMCVQYNNISSISIWREAHRGYRYSGEKYFGRMGRDNIIYRLLIFCWMFGGSWRWGDSYKYLSRVLASGLTGIAQAQLALIITKSRVRRRTLLGSGMFQSIGCKV